MIFFLTGVLVDKNLVRFSPFEWVVLVDPRCDDADATAATCGAGTTYISQWEKQKPEPLALVRFFCAFYVSLV
jgi:hypothetical protein